MVKKINVLILSTLLLFVSCSKSEDDAVVSKTSKTSTLPSQVSTDIND